ncbi:MAG TPA: AAA family ATPase [Geobacteraceae bacterium]
MLCFTRLRLGAFGKFRDQEFILKPGLNLVCGSNEAGKSTFAAAIAGIIFGFRRERDRYLPWGDGSRWEAEVAFTCGDREVVISRDFLTDKVRAVERTAGDISWRFEGKVSPAGRSSEREEYLAKVEEYWGFCEGDIFRNSVYVGQRDLPIDGDGNLSGRLQQLLSGFSEMDYDAVVTDLEKELYSVTKRPGGRAKDRELEEVRARLAEVAGLWQQGQDTLSELAKREAALAELSSWLVTANADMEKGRLYLEKVGQYHQLAGRKKSLEAEFARIDGDREKVRRLVEKKEDVERRLGSMGGIASLPDDFPAILQSYREGRAKLAALEEESQLTGGKPTTETSRPERLLFLLFPVWLAAGAGWYLYPDKGGILGGAATVVSILLAVPVMRRSQERRVAASRRAGRLDALNAELLSLREAASRFEDRFPGMEVSAPTDAARLMETFRAGKLLKEELVQVQSALHVLPEHAALVERVRELTRELAVVGERMEGIVGKGFPLLTPDEFLAAEEKVRRLDGEIKEKEKSFRSLEQEVAISRRTSLDLGAIEDEGEELKVREERLARRVAALQVAVELMKETLDEYRSTYLVRFAQEVKGKLSTLTAGRYREVSFDPAFNLSVTAAGEPRSVEAMSCGVQDQAYLAARIALGGILSRGKKLPFLLDDPLVNFDSERRTAALQSLGHNARDHQVLLFVHDERYARAKGSERWHKIMLNEGRDDGGQLHLL